MLCFASLGSGSKGNATLIRVADTTIMVDCGFSLKETEKRLQRLDIVPGKISAILITHEHGDHFSGVSLLSCKYHIPVWLSHGTLLWASEKDFYQTHCFSVHSAFTIESIYTVPYPVPHDAREPSQFVFSDGEKRLGLLTDCGSITPHIETVLDGVHALLLECNYDASMLENGPYPRALKRRVSSDFGHLGNHQAEQLLRRINTQELSRLVAMHISQNNNMEAHVCAALQRGLGLEYAPQWLEIACQKTGLDWRTV